MAAWTHDENKLFEMSVALLDYESPDFFENIRKLVPNKTVQDIQHHYQELERDFQMTESGQYDYALPPMTYLDQKNIPIMDQEVEIKKKRTRGGHWSDEEHRMFLSGVEKHGRGDWKAIARDFVPGRTSTQVNTHAQNYFQNIKKQEMKKQQEQEHEQEQEEMRYQQQQEIIQQDQQKRMPYQQQQEMQYQQQQQMHQFQQQQQMQYQQQQQVHQFQQQQEMLYQQQKQMHQFQQQQEMQYQQQQQMHQFQQHEQQQQFCSSSYPQNGYVVLNCNNPETSRDPVLDATRVNPHDASEPGCFANIAPDQHSSS